MKETNTVCIKLTDHKKCPKTIVISWLADSKNLKLTVDSNKNKNPMPKFNFPKDIFILGHMSIDG